MFIDDHLHGLIWEALERPFGSQTSNLHGFPQHLKFCIQVFPSLILVIVKDNIFLSIPINSSM